MKIACNKCHKIIDEYFVRDATWLKVKTDSDTYMLCGHCAKGFWQAVDHELPPVVKKEGQNGEN